MSDDFDWPSACRALLDAPPEPRCQPLLDALAAIAEGEVHAANEALAELGEAQRLFATFVVELAAAEAGLGAEALASVAERLHADVATNAVQDVDVSGLDGRWVEQVAAALPPESVAARDAYGYAQPLLGATIAALCAAGRAEDAVAYADALNPHFREDCATSWARVGLALGPGPGDAALLRAAAAGAQRPMIQDGGEEAEAHGACLEAFAEGGLAADHPAVVSATKGLLRLAKTRARKDVRSSGTVRATVAAALRARRNADAAWFAVAEALAERIWSDGLKRRADAASLLARRALGELTDAAFSTAAAELAGGPTLAVAAVEAVLARVAAGAADDAESPEHVALLRLQGVDVSEATQRLLDTPQRVGNPAVNRFVMGCRLSLPDAELDALFAEVPAHIAAEALVRGAAYGFRHAPERKRALLERGYPEGDRYGIHTPSVLPWLSAARRRAGEVYYANQGQARALLRLVVAALAEGAMDDVARILGRVGQPEVDGEPWVPFYRRGNRTFGLDEAAAEASVEALRAPIQTLLKQAKTGEDLLALADQCVDDAEAFEAVLKASRLKKFTKRKAGLPAVARIRLLGGAVEEAVALAEALVAGRVDDPLARTMLLAIGDHLVAHPEAVEDGLVARLCAVVDRVHPQFVTGALYRLGRAVGAARGTAVEGTAGQGSASSASEAAIAALQATTNGRFRMPGDHVFLHAGLGRGFAQAQRPAEAHAHFAGAVGLAAERAIYLPGPFLVRALAESGAVLAAADQAAWRALVAGALGASYVREKRHYAQAMALERSVRWLWHAGFAEPVAALLEADTLPTQLANDLRRSIWADIERAPDTLRALQSAWPQGPLPPEVAMEVLGAAARALGKAEHPAAAEVAEMAGQG